MFQNPTLSRTPRASCVPKSNFTEIIAYVAKFIRLCIIRSMIADHVYIQILLQRSKMTTA